MPEARGDRLADQNATEVEIFGRKTPVDVTLDQIKGFAPSDRNRARKDLEKNCFSFLVHYDKTWWMRQYETEPEPADLLGAQQSSTRVAR